MLSDELSARRCSALDFAGCHWLALRQQALRCCARRRALPVVGCFHVVHVLLMNLPAGRVRLLLIMLLLRAAAPAASPLRTVGVGTTANKLRRSRLRGGRHYWWPPRRRHNGARPATTHAALSGAQPQVQKLVHCSDTISIMYKGSGTAGGGSSRGEWRQAAGKAAGSLSAQCS